MPQQGAAAFVLGGSDVPGAQGAQGREVVGAGYVSGRQCLLQLREVAGGRAGEGFAVAGEVGEQEGAQPAAFVDRLVDGLGQPEVFLDVLRPFRAEGGERGGVVRRLEGMGEGATEHTQLIGAERHAAAGSVWHWHVATLRPNLTKAA
ncbi:hypothetical protein [Streptomyces lydicus]|uniref:hypothetical protein n=1 Tax=Streptomyces lydicus TaxID=47763 RepID=UPI00379F98F7